MMRINSAVVTIAALLSLSLPAVAQMSKPMAPTVNGAAGKIGASAGDKASAMNDNDSMPTTCQGMMEKAHPMMSNMASGSKKSMAMRHMHMANTAMTAGKEKSCMKNMKSAMHDMM